ncbi:MAG: nickel pincer cofactor biosynthesis protein LarC [Actinobacteria bacterium]|nr:nickel pincer cofactor biosynthesis protein LarC [Actinomycetota bacterium]
MCKKILYIECLSGVSGDMIAGAFLDLGIPGLDLNYLKKEMEKINLPGYSIDLKKEKRGAVFAGRLDVCVEGGQHSRNFGDIKDLIQKSSLSDKVKKTGIDIFTEIAAAESIVHNKPAGKVHFHEVGAVDSIVDIMSAAIAVDFLNPEEVLCSKIPLGSGFADTMHGKIPVPAPATVEILKGLPVFGGDFDFEVTTPTGAAIVKVLSGSFGAVPDMEITNTANGTGTKQPASKDAPPNILRMFFGRQLCSSEAGKNPDAFADSISGLAIHAEKKGYKPIEKLLLFSANIDDMSAELFGYASQKLFSSGALDVWTEPLFMKKNRPASKLCILCTQEQSCAILDTIFYHTTTFGVRVQSVERIALKRKIIKIKLPYGEAEVSIGQAGSRQITYSPEYESCAELAEKTGKSLKEIYRDLMFFLSRR